ncbi:Ig-like domain-containing protein [Cerasicoccus arenae]|uniref:Ig-like domain-containing protein n=1 Tax=Cerasicoccus arenae TaxID=424488 RepID=A0A8J3D8Y0_9BACT|nr:Ig-like domain-containing protein [Cerasicoccus arenae]MBK1857702.1 hypothetical protein [Cerasicoccus arenae]GHB91271.1 hypothetical protein GCM10007047_02900 [Cerasicoccus arenae]
MRLFPFLFLLLCAASVLNAGPTYPAWWLSEGVVASQPPPAPGEAGYDQATYDAWMASNYGVANLGQAKNLAHAAYDAMEAAETGSAGTTISTMVGNFSTDPDDNYVALNLGQLKAIAAPFYERMHAVGFLVTLTDGTVITSGDEYPWNPTTPVSENYALANLGQLKHVFSFTLDGWPPSAGADISIISPTSGTSILEGESISIKAWATNVGAEIDRVEFYVDDVLQYETGYAIDDVYTWTWYNASLINDSDTAHALKVIMVDVNSYQVESDTSTLNVYLDSDNDHLPDWWEMSNFANLDEFPDGDPDQDEATNLFEYVSGTDPNNELDDPANADSVVALVAPLDGDSILDKQSMIISAMATDNDTTIEHVEFYYDATLIASVYTPTSEDVYTWNWHNLPMIGTDATYSLTAVAVDIYGHRATSSAINLSIEVDSDEDGLPDFWELAKWSNLDQDGSGDPDNDQANNLFEFTHGTEPHVADTPYLNALSLVSVDSPQDGDKYFVGESLELTATATDSDTSIERVEFYANAQLIGTDYSPNPNSGYSFNWADLPLESDADTTYTFFARVIDEYGHLVDSANVSITVWKDTDTDGLPDTWEIQYFTNLDADPTGHSDADKANNLFEFLNGTNPVIEDIPSPNAESVITLILPSPTGSQVWQDESVELAATAMDADTEIDRVEFYYDDNFIGAVTSPIQGDLYYMLWNDLPNLGNGLVTTYITAKVIDVYGHRVDALQEAPLDIRGDADGDRLQDDWEITHFGVIDHDRQGDFDGDGYLNGFEHDNSTDPTDNNDYPLDNPSVIALVSPLDGSTVWEGEAVSLKASATDSDSILDRVEFYADGTLLGIDFLAANDVYAYNWKKPTADLNDGITARIIIARVYDSFGHSVDSGAITLNVIEDKDGDHMRDDDERYYFGGLSQEPNGDFDGDDASNRLELDAGSDPTNINDTPGGSPTVIAWNSPIDGDIVWQGDALNLVVAASDADTAIARVEFYDGATLLGIDVVPENSSNYSITWSPLPAQTSSLNSHTLTAQVVDAYGSVTVSSLISISIQGDLDLDGLGDDWELLHFSDLNETPEGDADSDNVSNLAEYLLGFNPNDTDSDDDTILDDAEDRDGDGAPDGWELFYGDFADYETADSGRDPDGDTLTNLLEYQYNRHPGVFDSDLIDLDDDGLLDRWEQKIIDAGLTDQDNDGDVDFYDVLGMDDFDGDGDTNAQEYANGTDPTDSTNSITDDPDADGLGSDAELLLLTHSLKPDNPSVQLSAAPVQN